MTTIVLPHESRDEWLEQRRDYITASQAAAIFTSPSHWAQVKAERSGVQTFAGNGYTEWGHEREPVLIARFVSEFPEENVVPNDELHVLVGTRWAATPDGVSDVCVVDAKTGSAEGLEKAHGKYVAQLQWQMHVCGVDHGYLVCEERLDGGEGFEPGALRFERHERDVELIEQMMHTCHRFLNGADMNLDDELEQVFNLRAEIHKKQTQLDEHVTRFKERAAGNSWSYSGGYGSVRVSPDGTSERFDSKAFKADHPELAEKYTKTVPVSGRVTFTERKDG